MIKNKINQSVLIVLLLTLISIFFIRFYNVFINHEIKDFYKWLRGRVIVNIVV